MTNKFVELEGGLDLETPPMLVEAGTCLEATNVYENVLGGYTTMLGYEKYESDINSPSAHGLYQRVYMTPTNTITNFALDFPIGSSVVWNAEVTNLTQSIWTDNATYVVISSQKTVGTECTGLPFAITGANGGEYSVTVQGDSGVPVEAYETDTADDYLLAAQQILRDLISQPAGTGTIRGIHQINDELIAWRDNGISSQASRVNMVTGTWQTILNAQYTWCSTTTTADRALVGDLVTINGLGIVTIIGVHNVYPTGHALDTAATRDSGVLYVHSYTVLSVITDPFVRISDSKAVGSALLSVIFDPRSGGEMSAVNHNFYGGFNTLNAYFGDGINPAMWYDVRSDRICPIYSDWSVAVFGEEVVSHVVAFQGHLIMASTTGSFVTSQSGNPDILDGTLGSVEIGVGSKITAFENVSADSLAVFTQDQTWLLSGTDPSTWKFQLLSNNSGAARFSVTKSDEVFAADDASITQLSRTEKLGGFGASTITNKIQTLVNGLDKSNTYAATVRSLAHMRFYYGTTHLNCTRVAYQSKNGNDSVRYGITKFTTPITVQCVNSYISPIDGIERTFYGASDGYVYKADTGTSHDGAAISVDIKLAYNNIKNINVKKRFEAINVEVEASGPSDWTVDWNLDDGDKDFDSRTLVVGTNASIVGDADFGDRAYTTPRLQRQKAKLKGTGFNIQFELSRSSAVDPQCTLTGYTIRFTTRGQVPS